jgi:hypothetical protein
MRPYKENVRFQDVLGTMQGSKQNGKFVNPQQAKQIYQYPAHPDIDRTAYSGA